MNYFFTPLYPQVSDYFLFHRQDLLDHYYLLENKPAQITCEAFEVDKITVSCAGRDLEESELRKEMRSVAKANPEGGQDILQDATAITFQVRFCAWSFDPLAS